MRQPANVLWALTKGQNAFKRQAKGAKSRLDCFSADPLNLTGLHNASSAGFTNPNAIGLTVNRAASKSGKSFRREFELRVNHKSHNGKQKRGVLGNKYNAAGLVWSSQRSGRGALHVSKTIQGLTFANSAKKNVLLQRLARLHASSRDLSSK